MSNIQQFYKDSNVFLTGGTGFVGKLIISKLMISCNELKMIYLLMREKGSSTIEERKKKLFSDKIFDTLKEKHPNFQNKITIIQGDLEKRGLGISKEDVDTIVKNVDIIIHSGATVRFNDELIHAIKVNAVSTSCIISLAKQMRNLKVMVHVSTAYSNCNNPIVEEKFYDNFDPDILLSLVKNNLNESTDASDQEEVLRLLESRPNTYVMSKAVGELVVLKEGKNLPIAVLRPSIITSTLNEPVSGWTGSYYGPCGLSLAAITGMSRVFAVNTDMVSDVVPADYVVNAIISVSWDVGTRFNGMGPPRVYNYVSGVQNPTTWSKHTEYIRKINLTEGNETAFLYPFQIYVSNWTIFKLLSFVLNRIPIFFMSLLTKQHGKLTLYDTYKRFEETQSTLYYFTSHQWTFRNENVQECWEKMNNEDKKDFAFDITVLSWDKFLPEIFLNGLKKFILKESMDPIRGKRNIERLFRRDLLILLVILFIFGYGILHFIYNFVH